MKGILLLAVLAAPACAGDELLANGDLAEWKDGLPAGWKAAKGAGAPEGKASEIAKGGDGGVRLSGDASTRVWRILTQDVAGKAEGYLRLRFEARVAGLKREGSQFDNCWIGLQGFGDGAQPLTRAIETVTTEDWTEYQAILPDSRTPLVRVSAFLSKTGKLEARKFVLEKLEPKDSADVLIRLAGRVYPMLDLKKIDWPAAAARHRGELAAAKDEKEFLAAAKALLLELRDQHVHLVGTDGAVVPTFVPDWKDNFNLDAVNARVTDARKIGGAAAVATAPGGFAYVRLRNFEMGEAELQEILAAIDARLDAPGFIVDVRHNGGGNELKARAVAAMFADRERVYARHRVRIGIRPDDLSSPADMKFGPREGRTFTRPVVVLTGSRCLSAGENFVEMMKTLPHVTLVGQPTCGSTGNPKPIPLPNGVTVWLSTVLELLPDETPTEGKGIAPDIEVKHEGDGDPTFEKAVEILKEKTKK